MILYLQALAAVALSLSLPMAGSLNQWTCLERQLRRRNIPIRSPRRQS
jgi:hypothetical protein